MNLYDDEFYQEMYERNNRVALEVIPYIINKLNPKSIIDLGCGQGIFLQVAKQHGVEVYGVDGEYVEKSQLLIDESEFLPFDLSNSLKIDKKYDIAMSFEVAEHIEKKYADIFVDNLTQLSDIIIFSAAIPNQGGVGHVNEEWPSYWSNKFKDRGYGVSNTLRDYFWNNVNITPLRRQNILLFVKQDKYEIVTNKFKCENIALDLVHPDTYKQKNDIIEFYERQNKFIENKLIEMSNRENSILCGISPKKYYSELAQRMSRYSLWEMVDRFDEIIKFAQMQEFLENFSCNQLDNYEYRVKSNKYLIWGAGEDGIRIVKLLKLLNKEVSSWYDSNENKIGTFADKMMIQSSEEMTSNFNKEIILVASRKYEYEIMQQIDNCDNKLKQNIFQYDEVYATNKRKEEFKKKAVLSYPPRWITIGVTSACTNKCLFCSYHGDAAKDYSNAYGLPYMLSLSDFRRIVDMAKEGMVPEIHICGTGEPFLNQDILPMIDYVIEKYGEVSLQTDLWKTIFEKKNYIDEIIKRQKHIKYISTDILSSIPEEHERIKQGSSYKEIMDSLEYIGKNSSLLIRIVVIVTKQNYKNIKGIIDELKKRNVNFDMLLVNLLSYDYSEFTSSDNVYTSKDYEITEALDETVEYAKLNNININTLKPAELEDDCYVFWDEFQTWPVKGCEKNKYGENMIPHACAAVIRGELNSMGSLFDYKTIMDAWNNEKLVELRENMINGKYPSEWCKNCIFYHAKDSIYLNGSENAKRCNS